MTNALDILQKPAFYSIFGIPENKPIIFSLSENEIVFSQ